MPRLSGLNLWVIVLSCLPAGLLWALSPPAEQIDTPERSGMEMRVGIGPAASGAGALEILIQLSIPYNTLQFAPLETRFHSQVSVDLTVRRRPDGDIFDTRVLHQDVIAAGYQDTESDSRTVDFFTCIPAAAGEYDVRAIRTDMDPEAQHPARKLVRVPAMPAHSIAATDFVFHLTADTAETAVLAGLGPVNLTYVMPHPFTVSLPLWSDRTREALTVRWSLRPLNISKMDSVVSRETLHLAPGWTHLRFTALPKPARSGPYILSVQVGEADHMAIEGMTTVALRWAGRSMDDRPMEHRIAQMTWLLSQQDRDQLAQAAGDARTALYEAIWTRENKVWEQFYPNQPARGQLEYFARVDYANQHYWTPQQEGWETDRGRIFILFGKPQQVSRHYMSGDQPPREIWDYRHLGRRYVFTDATRTGQFLLTETTRQ